jgi:hypothetical protein
MTPISKIVQAAYDAAQPQTDEDYEMITRAVTAILVILDPPWTIGDGQQQ